MLHRRTYNVTVLGATGLVGREILKVLDERRFPIDEITALCSEESAGERVEFGKRTVVARPPTAEAFDRVDLVLAAAGSAAAIKWLPEAVERGCVCIDTSAAYSADAAVPLIVPEVNPDAVLQEQGIIASPNCAAIQAVMALKPLHDAAGLRRVVVSTYHSVSGAGRKGMDELAAQTVALLNQKPFDVEVHSARIAFNLIPQVGAFGEHGDSSEELQIVDQVRRILELPELGVAATAVRVPVFAGHSESLNAEFEREITAVQARALLEAAPGVAVVDAPRQGRYPMPMDCAEQEAIFVGRIRRDPSVAHGLAMWVVADNLRKGAATNVVQIAELLARTWTAASA